MQLHQLLRYIPEETQILIYDISGILICETYLKSYINVDLYEYEILRITVKIINGSAVLCIILQK